jgi:hypothetical protein
LNIDTGLLTGLIKFLLQAALVLSFETRPIFPREDSLILLAANHVILVKISEMSESSRGNIGRVSKLKTNAAWRRNFISPVSSPVSMFKKLSSIQCFPNLAPPF